MQAEAEKVLNRLSKMDLEGVLKSISGAGNSINSLASSRELPKRGQLPHYFCRCQSIAVKVVTRLTGDVGDSYPAISRKRGFSPIAWPVWYRYSSRQVVD